jgi:hypothetical protein
MDNLSLHVQKFISGNAEYYGSKMTNDCEALPFITITGQNSSCVFIDSSTYYLSLVRFRDGLVNTINVIPYPEKFNGIAQFDFSAYSDAVLIYTNTFLQKWYLTVIGQHIVHQIPLEYPIPTTTVMQKSKTKNVQKCARISCEFAVHTNVTNNGGNYCCSACKHKKKHGPACMRKGLK